VPTVLEVRPDWIRQASGELTARLTCRIDLHTSCHQPLSCLLAGVGAVGNEAQNAEYLLYLARIRTGRYLPLRFSTGILAAWNVPSGAELTLAPLVLLNYRKEA
jgi:hypothetical protein